MTVIRNFCFGFCVLRWKLEEEPPTAAIGAGSIPFGGLLKINTTTFRGSEIDEQEIAVLVLSKSHLQQVDDFSTTVGMLSTALLRYSSPLRFCTDADEVAKMVMEEIYSTYEVRPEFLTGEDSPKLVLGIDLEVTFPAAGEMPSLPVDNLEAEFEFVKVSVPWRVGESFMGNLRRCVGLSGDGDINDVWEAETLPEDSDGAVDGA